MIGNLLLFGNFLIVILGNVNHIQIHARKLTNNAKISGMLMELASLILAVVNSLLFGYN